MLSCLQLVLIIYASWLIMLVHLRSKTTFTSKTWPKKKRNGWVCYRLHDLIDLIDNLDHLVIKFILFAHVFSQAVIRHRQSIILENKQFLPNLELPKSDNKLLCSFFLTTYLQKQLVMHLSAFLKNSIPQVVVSNKFER